MQQDKGQKITVSLRYCNKETYHRAKVSDYKTIGLSPSALERTALFYGIISPH